MSQVEIRQIGHVAATPVAKTLTANGRTQNKTVVTVISNSRWKDPEGKVSEKATVITWTLWGKVAVNAGWHHQAQIQSSYPIASDRAGRADGTYTLTTKYAC